MTPSDIHAILERLTRIEEKLDSQHVALETIRAETKKTNGRVTALERREAEDRARISERSRIESAQHAEIVGWIRPIIVGILVLAIGAAIVAGLNLNGL